MTIHLNMTMREYIALPAFNASLARILIQECPAAAFAASWLNPDRERDTTPEMDAGTIAHEILLMGSEDCVEVIDPAKYPNKGGGGVPDGWKNPAIRAARDAARAAGKCPVLPHELPEIRNMVDVARRYIDSLRPSRPDIWEAFQPDGGKSEVTITWDADSDLGPVPCKMRIDRMANVPRIMIDAKSTTRSAQPEAWGRSHLFGDDLDMSAALYRRGVRDEYGIDDAEYVFLVMEREPPYLCSLVGLDAAARALADEKVGVALEKWRRCVDENRWPGYPATVCYLSPPGWKDAQWQERAERERHAIPYDPAKLVQR